MTFFTCRSKGKGAWVYKQTAQSFPAFPLTFPHPVQVSWNTLVCLTFMQITDLGKRLLCCNGFFVKGQEHQTLQSYLQFIFMVRMRM